MSRQFWEESLFWATADGATITNTATETIVFPNITIPANYMQDGRALKLFAAGRYAATGSATVIFALRWGGVAGTMIAQSAAIVTTGTIGSANAATGAPWDLDLVVQTRSNGSAGTVFGMGAVTIYNGIAPTMGTVANYGVRASMNSTGLITPLVATVDLTADTALSLTCKWSAGSTSNATIGHLYTGKSLN